MAERSPGSADSTSQRVSMEEGTALCRLSSFFMKLINQINHFSSLERSKGWARGPEFREQSLLIETC